MTALVAIFLSIAGAAGAASPLVKNGVIQACVKAKGKNKGALRVVAGKRGCKRLRGWRPVSWSTSTAAGQNGAGGDHGDPGPQGMPGPAGPQGTASQVEKSLIETVQTQATQINALTTEVTELTTELGELEGTVGGACDQLSTLTDQSDEVLESLLGASIGGTVGGIFNVPSPPDPLGAFEC